MICEFIFLNLHIFSAPEVLGSCLFLLSKTDWPPGVPRCDLEFINTCVQSTKFYSHDQKDSLSPITFDMFDHAAKCSVNRRFELKSRSSHHMPQPVVPAVCLKCGYLLLSFCAACRRATGPVYLAQSRPVQIARSCEMLLTQACEIWRLFSD